jgi:hypothetical protein
MSRFFQNAKLSLDSLLNLITDLVADGLLFFRLLFRSRTALSAEILFLRKQLAFYEERQVQPRRLNDSARFSLILWSRLCNWKEALVIVKPETLIGWHRKGFKLPLTFGKPGLSALICNHHYEGNSLQLVSIHAFLSWISHPTILSEQ